MLFFLKAIIHPKTRFGYKKYKGILREDEELLMQHEKKNPEDGI